MNSFAGGLDGRRFKTGCREELTGANANRLLLHVDDDADLAFLLERILRTRQLTQWSFLHLSNGLEAVEYLRRSLEGELPQPDLLVLDIKMPGMGGLEVLEWVSVNIPDVTAVILSSSGLLEDRLRARDLGSKGYFEKSASFSELIEFLRGWKDFPFQHECGVPVKEAFAAA
jgi:CheY-like chemotaxis protein